MNPPLTIREATPQDVPALTALLDELTRAEGTTHNADATSLEAALFGAARRVPLSAIVVAAGDRPIASVMYYPGYDVFTASYGYHLSDFVVSESYRRQGIGTELFVALAKHNLFEGGQWISFTALQKNEAALAFYKRLGVIQVDVNFLAIGTRGLEALIAAS